MYDESFAKILLSENKVLETDILHFTANILILTNMDFQKICFQERIPLSKCLCMSHLSQL